MPKISCVGSSTVVAANYSSAKSRASERNSGAKKERDLGISAGDKNEVGKKIARLKKPSHFGEMTL